MVLMALVNIILPKHWKDLALIRPHARYSEFQATIYLKKFQNNPIYKSYNNT